MRILEGLSRRLGLDLREGRLLVRMGTLVATLLCAYTIAKVLRDALFLEEFGALALPYAYIGVALSAMGYIWIELRLTRRFTRIGASRFNQYAAIAFCILAAAFLPLARHWTTAVFYLWTGSQAMMLVPEFWALALDLWDSRRARRLFPLLTGCGLIGGMAGGGFAAWSAPFVSRVGLISVVAGLLVIASALTESIERHRTARPRARGVAGSSSRWDIVRKSSYIKVLTIGLALSVVVGTLVDFQFKLLIQRMFPHPHELTRFLGTFYAGLNAVSLIFQFAAAGWLLQRLGLAASTGLQPGAVLLFASWAALTTGGWIVVTMRWIQGVVSQTLGKSSMEIYYTAIRPNERRLVKPAIDTLVERWSDALVGVVLVIVLHLFHVPLEVITAGTAVLAALWLGVLFVLDRQYGRAFREALSRRWIEPETAPESMRLPAARTALLEALRSDEDRRVLLALQMSEYTRDGEIGRAVQSCLGHNAPKVRAAAVAAMEALGLADRERVIESFLAQPHEGLRRAAVRYLVTRGPDPMAFARRILDGDDFELQQWVLEALLDHPFEARRVLTWTWIDSRIESGTPEHLLLAARALGGMEGPATAGRLRTLLVNPDVDVRRRALESAVRRPSRELLEVLLPLLTDSELGDQARAAVSAIGNAAVPGLQRLLDDASKPRAQERAARALAQIASPSAVRALMTLIRSSDVRLRYLGLKAMTRMRVQRKRPVLPRSMVHRLFLRELHDYRHCMEPTRSLEEHAAPEVRLLAESYRESADRALERALQALACWYDPKPLVGVLHRLKSRDLAVASPALEYLAHVLPRAVFLSAATMFERAMEASDRSSQPDRLSEWIQHAWESDDAWLRACAVRASRYAPSFDPSRFGNGDESDPIVRAELTALFGRDRTSTESRPC